MVVMADFEEFEEPRSRSASFPDHYLIPYIVWCKNSKLFTCGWSILFFGVAIFSFLVATNIIDFNLSLTKRIAVSFVVVVCVVALCSCLKLFLRLLQSYEAYDNTLFEIVPRDDTVLSNSFSAHFEMEQPPFSQEPPNDEVTQSEMPQYASVTRSLDESSSQRISESKYHDRVQLPRHSISGVVSPYIPLLLIKRPLEHTSSSQLQNERDFKRSSNGLTVIGKIFHPPNYSTFENRPLFEDLKLTFDNGHDVSEAEPLLVDATFHNGCGVSENDPLLTTSTINNGSSISENQPVLTTSTIDNGSGKSENESLLTTSATGEQLFTASISGSSYSVSETETPSTTSAFDNGSGVSETETPLTSDNDCVISESKPLLVTIENGCGGVSQTIYKLMSHNGCDISETEPMLMNSTNGNECDSTATNLKSFNERT